jgi:hypothetical protein
MKVVPASVAIALLLTGAGYPTGSDAQGFGKILHCTGEDFHYIRFLATYTEQGQGASLVKQLDLDLEVDKASSLKPGQKVTFYVEGKEVGAVKLRKDRNGDLDGDLKLRSGSGKSFPAVKSGTKVTADVRNVKILKCKMT